MSKFGVDVGYTEDGVIVWAVFAPSSDVRAGALQGDYAGARKLLDTMGIIRPSLKNSLDSLNDIPTDIEPIFVTADELAPEGKKQ